MPLVPACFSTVKDRSLVPADRTRASAEQIAHADPCRAADDETADTAEHDANGLRLEPDAGQSMDGVVSSKRRRGSVDQRDSGLQPRIAEDGDEELAEDECRDAGKKPGRQRLGKARAAVLRVHCDVQTDEEGQRVDREGKEKPKQDAEAEKAGEATDEHDAFSRSGCRTRILHRQAPEGIVADWGRFRELLARLEWRRTGGTRYPADAPVVLIEGALTRRPGLGSRRVGYRASAPCRPSCR